MNMGMGVGRNQNMSSRGPLPLNLTSSRPTVQHMYQFDSREHKLRIVERLGTVGNALQSEVTTGHHQLYKGQGQGQGLGQGQGQGQGADRKAGPEQQRTHTGSQTTASGGEKVRHIALLVYYSVSLVRACVCASARVEVLEDSRPCHVLTLTAESRLYLSTTALYCPLLGSIIACGSCLWIIILSLPVQ